MSLITRGCASNLNFNVAVTSLSSYYVQDSFIIDLVIHNVVGVIKTFPSIAVVLASLI